MPRTVAIVCVRMGSERLPGKTMLQVNGKPLLGLLIDRIGLAKTLDDIVIATSAAPDCDPVERYCAARGVPCFRGAEHDLLGRMIGALESRQAVNGVMIYGDGFLIDPAVIDECVGAFRANPGHDLVGNDLKLTYPPGQLAETFTLRALKDAAARVEDPEMREHGTRFIRLHPELYALKNVEAPAELRRPELHLVVDTREDLAVMTAIIEGFGSRTDFTLREIIDFLDARPEIRDGNASVHRRWKASIDQSGKHHQ